MPDIHLSFSAEGGHTGPVSSPSPLPDDAIQFSRDVAVSGIPPQRVMAYFTDKGTWEHYDGSPCEHGPDVPLGEWTEVAIPLACRDGEAIRMKAGGPFYLAELPLSDPQP